MAVAPRPAATVVLLRDGPGGLEAYLQLRPVGMGFAGGLWVFPGGRVDAADRDPAIDARWAGPPPEEWAGRLGLPVDDARGHVVAACRETLEEAGLLLATPAPDAEELAEGRRELLAGSGGRARSGGAGLAGSAGGSGGPAGSDGPTGPAGSGGLEGSGGLAALLARLGVRLDTDRLRYWAWWVTPEEEPRRYDTRFFLAEAPAGAAVTAHLAEADRERWVRPGEAAADLGLPMLPPTRYTLRDLAAFGSVEAALAATAARRVERILPVLEGAELVMPWRERYPVPVPLPGPGGSQGVAP